MKKIFRNLKFGLLLCAGAFAASCSDVEDAMDEIPYTRVLTPLNFEADVDAAVGTDIKFSWSAVSNADAYLLELFEAVPTITTDDKGNEVEVYEMPEYFDSANAYKTIEVAKDAVPYTVKDLAVDKTFWARVQGVNAKIESSNWACLAEAVSTSAVRKALNPQAKERTSTSVTLSWDNADDKEDLTSVRYELVVPVEGVTATTLALSKEQIEDCEAKIDALEPGTNYKFTLLFGKSGSRGILTAYTRPSTEGTQVIKNSGELVNAISSATGDLELLLEYNNGELYDLSPLMTLNEKENIYDPFEFAYGLEIYGESTAEGAKPAIKLAIKPKSGKLHFEDVLIDGGNQCGVFVTTGGSLTDAEFINCEITGFTKGIWSGADTFNVDNLIYDEIYAHDINPVGAGGGDFIDLRIKAGSQYGTIDIKNSTFYACARTFIRCREGGSIGSVNVENCTFNQVTATNSASNNSGIFELQKFEPSAVKLTKCLFLNENNPNEVASQNGQQWVKLTSNKTTSIAPTCVGNYFYNVGTTDKDGKNFFFNQPSVNLAGKTLSQELALEEGGMILDDDPCTNSIAGKMYLKNGAITANKVGDPRWWNASAPVIVRPTELETVTEATTWNFTDKTKFDTETIESNQIIENIRIYAPAEVVMSEGITFGAAATVSTKGVPLTSALAFNAEGYGSIEVTAQGTGITSTVQIIAGGDAYSINADGKPHKIVLGDLVGANDIYVLPSVPNITFTRIAWTKDTTPEVVTQQLATPELTIDATSIEQGSSTAITATWEHNAHAATYAVTFNGTTTEVTDSEFVIAAETVAALAIGEYTISVIAKPTATSTKYLQSEAGEAKFRIKDPNASVKEPLLWDCNASSFDAIANKLGTEGSVTATIPDLIWDGLTILNGGKTKYGTATINGETMRFIQWGGKGAANKDRSCYFKASAPGKLYVVASNTGGSEDTARFVAVTVNGVEQTKFGGVASSTTTTCEFTIDISEETTIYVYPSGNGLRFFSIKYVFD
ncbi:MAG: fibronectin type III domain-containing protein [Alistipes sp.]|nr:fibronectin type III domain-containing protein [Alistipes sp.]